MTTNNLKLYESDPLVEGWAVTDKGTIVPEESVQKWNEFIHEYHRLRFLREPIPSPKHLLWLMRVRKIFRSWFNEGRL